MVTETEKIIKGLKTCYCPPAKCEDCPYYDIENCNDTLCLDALALLKKQEKRLKEFELEKSWDEHPDRMGNW